MLWFSFTPKAFGINENHPKLRFIWFIAPKDTILYESIIRWICDPVVYFSTLPEGLGFISFRPLSGKK